MALPGFALYKCAVKGTERLRFDFEFRFLWCVFVCLYKTNRCAWLEILQSMGDRELMGNPGFIMILYHFSDGRRKTPQHLQTVHLLSAYIKL